MTEGDGENRWDGRAVDDVVVGAADAAGQHRYADLPATRDKNRMVDDTRHPHCARPARRPGERIIVSLRGEMPARSAARRCALPAREQICSGRRSAMEVGRTGHHCDSRVTLGYVNDRAAGVGLRIGDDLIHGVDR